MKANRNQQKKKQNSDEIYDEATVKKPKKHFKSE